jgi:hypothetical protein
MIENVAKARAAGRDHENPFGGSTTLGWQPTCAHAAEPVPCLVLDPFSGLATTGLAALKQGRRFVGIELSAEYIRMAHERAARIYPLLVGDTFLARLGAHDAIKEEILERLP